MKPSDPTLAFGITPKSRVHNKRRAAIARRVMSTAEQIAALRRALVRLLWISISDGGECTCEFGDICPLCDTCKALGLGRWRGAKWAKGKEALRWPK